MSITATPQLAIIWGLSVVVVLFFMLVNLDNDIEFRSTVVFLSVLIASIVITLILVGARGSELKGKNTKFFFAEKITFRKLAIYLPVGFFGSLLWAILISSVGVGAFGGFSASQMTGLVTLWGSGMIFGLVLILSKTIIVPWLSHGLFNALVFTLDKTGFGANILDTQSLPIPEIGIPVAQFNQIIIESIFQIFLVSLAEEHYRVLIIAIFLVSFKGFKNRPFKIWVAVGFSVFTWGMLHTLQNLTG